MAFQLATPAAQFSTTGETLPRIVDGSIVRDRADPLNRHGDFLAGAHRLRIPFSISGRYCDVWQHHTNPH